MIRPELLAPAGDLPRLKTAVHFGADAVYIGGKKFSLRSRASNFDLADIEEGVRYAHSHQAKLYVTVNMIPHQEDLQGLHDYLRALDQIGVDAVIVASLYIAQVARQISQRMEVHLSTQQSSANIETLDFYKAMGVDRVVLARECSLEDITQIVEGQSMPIEVFIHGGMCVNVSGRCTLSNYMTLRDANRGGCAQSCRWKYFCLDENLQPVHDENTLFSMSSKDLNATVVLSDLIQRGVSSLKIEGRMKSEYYLATVVGAYRRLIDDLLFGKDEHESVERCNLELAKAENRETFDGFFLNKPSAKGHLYDKNGTGITQEFLATVISYDPLNQMATIEVRNHFSKGWLCEVFGPNTDHLQFAVTDIINSDQELTDRVYKPMEIVQIKIPFKVMPEDFIRKVRI
ncbi:MAG: collagenase-like protease [Firmicutes bacterium HGW-Firmicutes-20]|nr:MAG: collagenase-like protease [Firmicutes bacterium HGW-Firmicutes-20]PKM67766.1 MAG: collagenase-like protease [Firmicutes bacterium HGW-Firmicutes-19]